VTSGRGRVAVTGYARTPFGRFGGALRGIPLPALGALPVRAALARAGVEPEAVDEVALGVNFPAPERSVARQVSLRAGLPERCVAYTVDRACCSSLAAISLASRGLVAGDTSVAVAGGAENLSRIPYFLTGMRWGVRRGPVELADLAVVSCPHTGIPRAVQAGAEAAAFGIGRDEQDEWALCSQQRYAQALAAGAFDDEIEPVDALDEDGAPVALGRDEPPRPGTTLEKLSALKTVYGSASVTAGNAPDLSSGASALVLTTEAHASAPLATLEGFSLVSGDPQKIASMPAEAARLALERSGLTIDEVDLIEINEAFAAVPLVTTLVLAGGDRERARRLRERTNVNGGAIAIGHPTGATGARLAMTAIAELRRRGGGAGLVTICGGIGEAEALIVRVGDGR
jgi:acetyl-CoA C-acetyltransferase